MRSARGFTLLEVLAAVMILSLWYMIIANSAVLGLRAEGESRRRMEAGRIADMKLAELEAIAVTGAAPEIMNETEEIDDFEVTWAVGPFAYRVGGQAPGETNDPDAIEEPANLRQYVTFHAPSLSRNIRAIFVRVTWGEEDAQRAVIRSTFAFDQAKAAEIYSGKAFESDDGSASNDDKEDEDDANRSGSDVDFEGSQIGSGGSTTSGSRAPGRVR